MEPPRIHILLVEDDPDDAFLLRETLAACSDVPFTLRHATRLSEALEAVRDEPADVILLDLSLPDGRGLGTLRGMKAGSPHLPIVVLTGLDDRRLALSALREGAQDYLVKGQINAPLLERSLRYAIERIRAAEALLSSERRVKRSRRQLRDLAAHLQSVREEERTRIAREIHDELGQALTILKMDASWLARRLGDDQAPLREKALGMAELITGTIQTVRKIATELRPGILDELGLVAALEWQAQAFQTRTGIRCRFRSTASEVELDPQRSTALFRVFQEILTNVARHAGAGRVDVLFRRQGDQLQLRVRDDGRGIREAEITGKRSLGLLGMRERVLPWGGELRIEGRPGEGTLVTVRLPLAPKPVPET